MRIETPNQNKRLIIEVVPGLLAGQPPTLRVEPQGVEDPFDILCLLHDAQLATLQQIAMMREQARQDQIVRQLAQTPLRVGQ